MELQDIVAVDPSELRIEVRQTFDLRYQWVLMGPSGSLAESPLILRKTTCLRFARIAQKRSRAAQLDDVTLTAPTASME